MHKFRNLFICSALIIAVLLGVLSCSDEAAVIDNPEIASKTGTIKGKAVYLDADDDSGITISLECTDGLFANIQ